jgi:hypothetical protein
MGSINVPADVTARLDALDAAVADVGALNLHSLDAPVRLHVLERLETSCRRQVVVGHDVIAGLTKEAAGTVRASRNAMAVVAVG